MTTNRNRYSMSYVYITLPTWTMQAPRHALIPYQMILRTNVERKEKLLKLQLPVVQKQPASKGLKIQFHSY